MRGPRPDRARKRRGLPPLHPHRGCRQTGRRGQAPGDRVNGADLGRRRERFFSPSVIRPVLLGEFFPDGCTRLRPSVRVPLKQEPDGRTGEGGRGRDRRAAEARRGKWVWATEEFAQKAPTGRAGGRAGETRCPTLKTAPGINGERGRRLRGANHAADFPPLRMPPSLGAARPFHPACSPDGWTGLGPRRGGLTRIWLLHTVGA